MKLAKIMDNNLSNYELVHYAFKNQLNSITAIACFYASKLKKTGSFLVCLGSFFSIWYILICYCLLSKGNFLKMGMVKLIRLAISSLVKFLRMGMFKLIRQWTLNRNGLPSQLKYIYWLVYFMIIFSHVSIYTKTNPNCFLNLVKCMIKLDYTQAAVLWATSGRPGAIWRQGPPVPSTRVVISIQTVVRSSSIYSTIVLARCLCLLASGQKSEDSPISVIIIAVAQYCLSRHIGSQ